MHKGEERPYLCELTFRYEGEESEDEKNDDRLSTEGGRRRRIIPSGPGHLMSSGLE